METIIQSFLKNAAKRPDRIAAALGYEISYGDVFTLKTPRALAAKPGKGKGAYDDFADYDYTEEEGDDTFSDLKMINSIADDVTNSRAIGLITLRRNSNA